MLDQFKYYKMRLKYKLIFLCFTVLSSCSAQQNIYVSPMGLVTNKGSVGAAVPFERAMELVAASNNKSIVVSIDSGIYILDTTLAFNSAHSGIKNVTYKASDINNKPVISGGYYIESNSWQLHDSINNIWSANIGQNYARQVYVNGQKITRARSENATHLVENKKGYLSSTIDYSNWKNINDIEIIATVSYKSNKLPIKAVFGSQIIIEETIWKKIHAQRNFEKWPAQWVENAYELIDQAGEWYIDRATKGSHILYIKTDTASAPINVVVPSLSALITANGLNNVTFKDLIFEYSNWITPSERDSLRGTNYGVLTSQAQMLQLIKRDFFIGLPATGAPKVADYQMPGALRFVNSKDIAFLNCKFNNIGSTALEFNNGCKDNIICNNEFTNIAANAISIGNWRQTYNPDYKVKGALKVKPGNDLVANNLVSNNYIDNVGTDYFSSAGIFVSFARGSVIEHNELSNFPYSGISVGWGWNNDKTFVGVNSIKYNKLDCSNQFIQDGGAIYTLGNQALPFSKLRTQINHNYIYNYKIRYGAIYLDEGSSNVDVHNNTIVSDTMLNDKLLRWAFISPNNTENITYRDNVFKNYGAYPDPYFFTYKHKTPNVNFISNNPLDNTKNDTDTILAGKLPNLRCDD